MSVVIIYHNKCIDGTTSMLILKKKFPDAYYIAMFPDSTCRLNFFKDKRIILADICCFNSSQLRKLSDIAIDITILDHHQTTLDTLKSMIPLPSNIIDLCDKNFAGCQLAWKYVYGDIEPKDIVNYIGDNDRWVHTRYLINEVMSVIYQMDNFELEEAFEKGSVDEYYEKGKILFEKFMIDVNKAYSLAYLATVTIDSRIYNVWVTCPNENKVINHVCIKLCERKLSDGTLPDFAVCYNNKMRKIGMRSIIEGLELHKIANIIGINGGGHDRSAGCFLPKYKRIDDVFKRM